MSEAVELSSERSAARVSRGSAIEVSAARWAFALAAIAGFSLAMILLARTSKAAASLAAGVLFTVPLCSLGEWLVHGVLYHRRIPGLEARQRQRELFFLGRAHQMEERDEQADDTYRQLLPAIARPLFPLFREKLRTEL